ncbi:MAG: DeoR/GlpR transcriptional regulator [Opitutaceae bacterium]|nr:DeoR/GlpR transcriptional regulator [Opitutaceae bacterium]
MLPAQRHLATLRLLSEKGCVSMAEIARHFNVSTATARRDAMLLAKSGKVSRSHGGLLPLNFYRETPGNTAIPAGGASLAVRIARRACELLPHDGNVFIGGGPIALQVGRLLLDRPELRIYSNSVPLIALAPHAHACVTGIGGEIKKGSRSLTGGLAHAWLAHLRFDACILEADGLDEMSGVYVSDADVAALQTEVLKRSAMSMLVAEASKWNSRAAVRLAPWASFSSLVTTRDLPRGARIALGSERVKVCLT